MTDHSGMRRDPLTEALAALWPAASVVRGRSRTLVDADAAAAGHHYVVVPGAGGAGRAVPQASAAASRAVRDWSAALRPRQVLVRSAAAAALRCGVGSAWRDRLRVAGSRAGSLGELLDEVFDTDVTFSLSVGTRRVNRKPVLEIFDRDGHTLGFAKVGLSWVAARDVAAEAAALPHLVGLDAMGIRVPSVLWAGTWEEVPVLVMSAVARGVHQRRHDRRHPPLREMGRFVDHFAEPAVALAESRWLEQLEHAFARLDDADLRRRTASCLQALVVRSGATAVPISAWHGDWTPWNMARHHGHLGLWDWERFATGVPAGLDQLHYRVNVATVRHGTEASVVLRSLETGADADGLLAGCYLAAINARYLPLAEGPGGAAIAARAEVLLRSWESWCLTPAAAKGQGSGRRGVSTAAAR